MSYDRERDEAQQIDRQGEEALDRTFERARRQDTRAAILSLLAEGFAELTEKEILARLSALLPGKRRGNPYHLAYHLELLCRSRLIVKTDDDPPRYRLR